MNRRQYFAVPYVVWMTVFVLAPIVLIVIYAFTSADGNITLNNFSSMENYVSVFIRSFILAIISTAICLAMGYPVASFMAREPKRQQRIIMMLVMLPMWMNFLLRTYAWMSILEHNGLLNRFLSFLHIPALNVINTEGAVVIGMIYNFLPFMILPIYSVVVKIDKSLIEAAQDLGGSPVAVFLRVILPLSLPGIISGVTMVFVPAVSTFVISQLLGGGANMLLGDLIEMQFLGQAYNPNLGSAIALVMMVIVMFFMLLMNRFGESDDNTVLM